MSIDDIIWRFALPFAGGLAVGYWVRHALRAAISLLCILTLIAVGMFVWEACTRQPNLLEGLGVVQRPDPVQRTLVIGKAALAAVVQIAIDLPVSAYIGVAAGIIVAVARGAKSANK